MKDRGMNTELNDTAIDEIVASCNGDMRGALKALMLVNEQLEAELQHLHAAARSNTAQRGASALH
jgi:replication-associated recombination protein RarA